MVNRNQREAFIAGMKAGSGNKKDDFLARFLEEELEYELIEEEERRHRNEYEREMEEIDRELFDEMDDDYDDFDDMIGDTYYTSTQDSISSRRTCTESSSREISRVDKFFISFAKINIIVGIIIAVVGVITHLQELFILGIALAVTEWFIAWGIEKLS